MRGSHPTSSPRRREVLSVLAALVCELELGHPSRVAIDGVTASGKSTLATELAQVIAERGRPVVHLSADDFHHPRSRRYRQGRQSATGYYEDAFDLEALTRVVLDPLGPGGTRCYRSGVWDLASDVPATVRDRLAPEDAVVVVDGSFLLRPELRHGWDLTVFVDTPLPIALARGVRRDAVAMGGEEAARRAYEERYLAAGRLYLEAVRPAEIATVVVENADLDQPTLRIVAPPEPRQPT